LPRFWCCRLQKMRKYRRIAVFLMLSTSENQKASRNCFVHQFLGGQLTPAGKGMTSTLSFHLTKTRESVKRRSGRFDKCYAGGSVSYYPTSRKLCIRTANSIARRGTINLLLGFGGDFSGVLPRDPESISASKGKAPNGGCFAQRPSVRNRTMHVILSSPGQWLLGCSDPGAWSHGVEGGGRECGPRLPEAAL